MGRKLLRVTNHVWASIQAILYNETVPAWLHDATYHALSLDGGFLIDVRISGKREK